VRIHAPGWCTATAQQPQQQGGGGPGPLQGVLWLRHSTLLTAALPSSAQTCQSTGTCMRWCSGSVPCSRASGRRLQRHMHRSGPRLRPCWRRPRLSLRGLTQCQRTAAQRVAAASRTEDTAAAVAEGLGEAEAEECWRQRAWCMKRRGRWGRGRGRALYQAGVSCGRLAWCAS
jgi:hypothetical protein